MNTLCRRIAFSTCAFFLASLPSLSAAPKDYQVTGPVIALTDSSITIQKGTEKWEVGRDATTKGAESVKVGDRVTVHYTMTAAVVEEKPVKAAAGTKKAPQKAGSPAPAASPSPAA